VDISKQFLLVCKRESDELLNSIVTRDESRVNGFETERKMQSVEFRLKASPTPSAGRVMLKFSGTVKAWRSQNSCVLAQTLTQNDILKCCES
jgi:hypothetical protein